LNVKRTSNDPFPEGRLTPVRACVCVGENVCVCVYGVVPEGFYAGFTHSTT